MGAVLIILLVLRIIGVIVCSNKAKELNRSQGGWGIFGFVMPIVAMIWIQFMKPVIMWDKNVSLEPEAEIVNIKIEEVVNDIKKPQSVTTGINLLVISIVLGIINSIVRHTTTPIENSASNVFILILNFGIMFFFIYQMNIGKKWARTTFLILFILGSLMMPFSLSILFKANPIVGGMTIVLTLIQVIALFYIYREDSNDWYNSNSVKMD